jgi:hypothetical protein
MQNHLAQGPLLNQQKVAAGSAPSRAATAVLASCVYLNLQCCRCGDVRQTIAELPSSATVPCPECGIACSFMVLGKGLTRRKIPFSEIRTSEAQLLSRRDELPDADPVRYLSG